MTDTLAKTGNFQNTISLVEGGKIRLKIICNVR
jgi:hypothetical protein